MNNAMFYAWMSQASYLYFNESKSSNSELQNNYNSAFLNALKNPILWL